ncbi:cell division protein SepF [Gemella morbillorum]|uniref:cell division protein SepF n=1 Tax=Gemella morbillorum TaxID=29391 RepID=UPI00319E156A
MSMMKKFNNLFVNEDDFGDEVVEKSSAPAEKQKVKNIKKDVLVGKSVETVIPPAKTNNVILTEPLVFADSKDIIDDIKRNKVVIINLSKLDLETADRLLDFISGGIYALGARLKTIGEDIYLCVPNGVEVSGDFYEGEY